MDLDSIELFLNRLLLRVRVARSAQAKLPPATWNTKHTEARTSPDVPEEPNSPGVPDDQNDLDALDELSAPKTPEDLKKLLDTIIKDAQEIQLMIFAQLGSSCDADQHPDGSRPQRIGRGADGQTPAASENGHAETHSSSSKVQSSRKRVEQESRTSHDPETRRSQRLRALPQIVNQELATRPLAVRASQEHSSETSPSPSEPSSSEPSSSEPSPSPSEPSSSELSPSPSEPMVPSQLQTPPVPKPLAKDQMRERFVQTLQGSHCPGQPYAKYDLVDLPPLDLKPGKFTGEHLLQHCYVKVSSLSSITHKTVSGIGFDPCDFEWAGPTMTQEEMKAFFNSLCQDPPKRPLRPYYIGPVEPVQGVLGLGFEPLVHAGYRLCMRNDGNLPGINTVYMYISFGKGVPAPLHKEDAELGSVNLVRKGAPKLWLTIEEEWALKLEEKLLELYGVEKRCSQAVRHLGTLVSPEQLDGWGIPYFLDCCNAGQMIETKPGSYHQVVNMGYNIAESINIEFDNTPDMLSNDEYQWCRHDTCAVTDTLSKDTFELSTCSRIDHDCTGRGLHQGMIENTLESSCPQAGRVDVLRNALQCDSYQLALCEKARLVQMIAHCCEPTTVPAECPQETDQDMFKIIHYFATRKDSFKFVDRVYLTRLASKCETEEEELRQEARQRMLPEKEDYTSTAISRLTQGLKLQRRLREKLMSFRKQGATLKRMCEVVGPNVLTVLPCESISADALYISCSTGLQQTIKPSDYHRLCGSRLDFFLYWLLKVFPDKLQEGTDGLRGIAKPPQDSWQVFTQESLDLLPKAKRQKRS